MIRFNCDYLEGTHPRILQALAETNMVQTCGYGEDEYCEAAREAIKKVCKCEKAQVHFLVGGTQANLTVISSILRPHQAVLCVKEGHINVHETGAIEATGHKVLAIEGKDDYSPVNGDVVIYKDAANNSIEYIYSDGSWVELGDVSAEAKRIEELESRMDAAEVVTAKVPTIESNILAIQTAASNLEARVKANEDAISEHATAAAALATRVGTLETDLATTAADLRKELAAEASARAAAITAETTAREAAVSNLQGQIDTINGRLTWNKMGSVSSD